MGIVDACRPARGDRPTMRQYWETSVLSEADAARNGRSRHWIVDAVLGGVAALGAITMAKAALPASPGAPPPATTAASSAAVAVPPPPAEPVKLIAFQEPVPGHGVVSPFGLR